MPLETIPKESDIETIEIDTHHSHRLSVTAPRDTEEKLHNTLFTLQNTLQAFHSRLDILLCFVSNGGRQKKLEKEIHGMSHEHERIAKEIYEALSTLERTDTEAHLFYSLRMLHFLKTLHNVFRMRLIETTNGKIEDLPHRVAMKEKIQKNNIYESELYMLQRKVFDERQFDAHHNEKRALRGISLPEFLSQINKQFHSIIHQATDHTPSELAFKRSLPPAGKQVEKIKHANNNRKQIQQNYSKARNALQENTHHYVEQLEHLPEFIDGRIERYQKEMSKPRTKANYRALVAMQPHTEKLRGLYLNEVVRDHILAFQSLVTMQLTANRQRQKEELLQAIHSCEKYLWQYRNMKSTAGKIMYGGSISDHMRKSLLGKNLHLDSHEGTKIDDETTRDRAMYYTSHLSHHREHEDMIYHLHRFLVKIKQKIPATLKYSVDGLLKEQTNNLPVHLEEETESIKVMIEDLWNNTEEKSSSPLFQEKIHQPLARLYIAIKTAQEEGLFAQENIEGVRIEEAKQIPKITTPKKKKGEKTMQTKSQETLKKELEIKHQSKRSTWKKRSNKPYKARSRTSSKRRSKKSAR